MPLSPVPFVYNPHKRFPDGEHWGSTCEIQAGEGMAVQKGILSEPQMKRKKKVRQATPKENNVRAPIFLCSFFFVMLAISVSAFLSH